MRDNNTKRLNRFDIPKEFITVGNVQGIINQLVKQEKQAVRDEMIEYFKKGINETFLLNEREKKLLLKDLLNKE